MLRSSAGLLALLVLAGCVSPRTPPPAQAAPRRVAVPAPVPPAQAPLVQAGEDWRDIPLTAGTWRYGSVTGGTASTFGPGGIQLFSARCDSGSRTVTLSRSGTSPGPLSIQTSNGIRILAATPLSGRLSTTLRASDPFLDAIAFSRGRFVVTSPPDVRLVIPAWPEFARVVEDCRG